MEFDQVVAQWGAEEPAVRARMKARAMAPARRRSRSPRWRCCQRPHGSQWTRATP